MLNWAIITIGYIPGLADEVIHATTNTPCHLTLCWTLNTPLRHSLTSIVRGQATPWGAYFCFDPYECINQNEAGDTLVHSFTVTPWAHCETRYFACAGTIGGEVSPSVSAIYQRHHVAHYQIAITTFKDNYLNAHFFSRATNFGTSTLISVAEYPGEGTERIPLLAFNLDPLANVTILAATLRLYLLNIPGGGQNNIVRKLLHTDWSELTSSFIRKSTGITWNNVSFSPTDFTTVGEDTQPVPASGYIDFKILELLEDALANNITLNVAIMGDSPSPPAQSYNSREHATASTRPQLLVDVKTPT